MEIRHLECFLKVAEKRSFSRAADDLHVTQSNISKLIKDMEDELGVQLFYRNPKSIDLTAAAETLIPEARQIVSSFRDVGNLIKNNDAELSGQVFIGIPPITAVVSFAEILGSFQRRYPKVRIRLYETGPLRVEDMLAAGSLDFGIFTPENKDLFEWIWFENDPHCLVMPETHPLTGKETVRYADLDRQPLIIYSRDYKLHDQLLARCRRAGAFPEVVFETIQLEMMLEMVREDLGVAFLPKKICEKLQRPGIVYRELSEESVDLKLALTWKKDRYLSAAAKRFLEEFDQGSQSGSPADRISSGPNRRP